MLETMQRLPKPILFALFAAAGGIMAALLAEVFLYQPAPTIIPKYLVLAIDTSGSMAGDKIAEVKQAALEFVERRQSFLAPDQLAILQFGEHVQVLSGLTQDGNVLGKALRELKAQGNTPLGAAVQESIRLLEGQVGQRYILVFTDGQPTDSLDKVFKSSAEARQQGIQLVAVATEDANQDVLRQMTGDPKLIFSTVVGEFERAFQQAEEAIYGRNLLTGPRLGLSLTRSLLQVIAWTAFLGIGISLLLILAQNFSLRRPLISNQELLKGLVGGMVVGGMAGFLGQFLFFVIAGSTVEANPTILQDLTTVLAWSILGLLLGTGMAQFVPNLARLKGLLGGGVGGLIGATIFLLMAGLLSELMGRLLGAGSVGFFVGLMVAFAELGKEAWLVVHWGPQDKSYVTLGKDPVLIGAARNAHIYFPKQQGFPEEMGVVTFNHGTVEFHNKVTGRKQILRGGSQWTVGRVVIEVKVSS